jgi:L-ribulose-5-phosphate 4-epimerase
LTEEEIAGDYERNTGKAIVRRFHGLDPAAVPAVLVAGHAPFCWGKTPMEAAHIAVILETVARMAIYTTQLRPDGAGVSQALLDRHYLRKHGADATYGQK